MSEAEQGSAGTSGAPVPNQEEHERRARVFTLGSWLMLPGLVVSFTVGFAISQMFMVAFDVPRGRLLTEAGVKGWLATVFALAIGVAPLVGGVLLGRQAVREGAGRGGKAALIVNAVLLAYLVGVQVLARLVA